MRKFMGITLILLLIAAALISLTASAEMTIDGYAKLKKGDYMEFDLDMDLGEGDYEVDYTVDEQKHRMEVLGEEKVTAGDGKEYDCYKVKTTMITKGSGTTSMMDVTVETEMDNTYEATSWVTKDGWVEVKSTVASSYYYKMAYKDIEGSTYEEYLKDTETESESTGTTTYTKVKQAPPFPLNVGDSWEEEDELSYEGEDKTREKEGDGEWSEWKTTTETYDSESTNEVEVIREEEVTVPAGTFNCLVLKSVQDPDYSDDYELMYIDSRGLWVKTESYSDGKLQSTVELKSYSLSGSGSNDGPLGFLPGFGVLAVLSVMGVGYLIPRKR